MSTKYSIQTNALDVETAKTDEVNNTILCRRYNIRSRNHWDRMVDYWNARRRLWICVITAKDTLIEDGPHRISLRHAQEKAIAMIAQADKHDGKHGGDYGGKYEYQIWLNYNWHEHHHGIDCVECTIDSYEPILPKPNTQPPKNMLTSP